MKVLCVDTSPSLTSPGPFEPNVTNGVSIPGFPSLWESTCGVTEPADSAAGPGSGAERRSHQRGQRCDVEWLHAAPAATKGRHLYLAKNVSFLTDGNIRLVWMSIHGAHRPRWFAGAPTGRRLFVHYRTAIGLATAITSRRAGGLGIRTIETVHRPRRPYIRAGCGGSASPVAG